MFNFKTNDNFIIISGLVMALIGSLFSLLVVRNALTKSLSLGLQQELWYVQNHYITVYIVILVLVLCTLSYCYSSSSCKEFEWKCYLIWTMAFLSVSDNANFMFPENYWEKSYKDTGNSLILYFSFTIKKYNRWHRIVLVTQFY